MVAQSLPPLPMCRRGVEQSLPKIIWPGHGQRKENRFTVGIKHNKKSITLDRLAFFVHLLQLLSIEKDPQAMGRMCIPINIGHFPAARFKPGKIPDASPANAPS